MYSIYRNIHSIEYVILKKSEGHIDTRKEIACVVSRDCIIFYTQHLIENKLY